MALRFGTGRWRGLICGVALALIGGQAAAQGVNDPSVFTVAAVPVDVTANSAALARLQALADGQRQALRVLLERLTLPSEHERLPSPDDAGVRPLVQALEIADERRSSTRYIAKLTVRFKPDAVRELLREAQIPYSETVSKPVLVLAVFEAEGETRLWEEPNPWRAAWAGRESRPGLLRFILPLGDLADVIALPPAAALAGDETALAAVAGRYGLSDTIVAHANVSPGGAEGELNIAINIQRRGSIGNEPYLATHTLGSFDSLAPLFDRIVAEAAAKFEQDWKAATQLHHDVALSLNVRLPLNSLQDWVEVRRKLEAMAELRSLDVIALDRAEARISLQYFGDPARLAIAMAQRDLELREEQGQWTLRRIGAVAPAAAPAAQ